MPEVSVIIPTYNRAWCLAQAIESVLAQDFMDFELIVVDDGSDDNTNSVLAKFPGIRVITQKNKGVSNARNTGVRESTGHLIAFLDSDDLWKKSKLSIQVEFFRKNPDALICQTQEIWIRNGKRVNPGKRHQKFSGYFFEKSLELCLVSPSAVMIRRSFFEQINGFDVELPACEDYDMWLRIGLRHPVYLIDQTLIIKRGGHSDQLSREPGLDAYRIKSLVNLLENEPLDQRERQAVIKILEKKCRIYANGCLKRNRKLKADFYLKLAGYYK